MGAALCYRFSLDGVRKSNLMATRLVDDAVLATAHELAVALHRVGALDQQAFRDIEQLCRPRPPSGGSKRAPRNIKDDAKT